MTFPHAAHANGTEAHGAGFAAGVQGTTRQLEFTQVIARLTDRHHFGMGGRVVGAGDTVVAARDHLTVLHDHTAERTALVALHAGVPYARHPMPGLIWPVSDSRSGVVDAIFWSIEVFIMPLFLVMAGCR